MDYSQPRRADALACEYVTGTLRGAARRRFEALLPAHPALADAVAQWQARLMPMHQALPPVEPPARVWAGIAHRLWPAPASVPWWQRLGLWRALSGATGALALVLALQVGQAPEPEAPLIVVLDVTGAVPDAGTRVVASFSADGQALVVRPLTPVQVAPGRSLQLWWARKDGPPQSLGLIDAQQNTRLLKARLEGGLRGSGLDHMAVSVEPAGGSPTGKPTGPVVFYGNVQI